MRQFGPKSYVTSIVVDWRNFYVDQVRKRLAGTWSPSTTLLPMGGGVDIDAWGESVPAPVRKQADAVRTKILGGWSPFTGEIKDSKGVVRGQGRREDDGRCAVQLGLVDRWRARADDLIPTECVASEGQGLCPGPHQRPGAFGNH